jgi:glycerophosphoryl diester phosphodiesterase
MSKTMLVAAIGMSLVGAAVRADRLPEIIAHRGESSLAPENTLAAFHLAWQRGADAVELDVHLTADGHLAVCHDHDTQRTTGRKLVIRRSTLAELRALDAGAWKGAQWAGQKIPTLAEVLDTIPEKRRLFVEVKSGPETVPALQKAVAASGRRPEQIVFISFHPPVIAEVKRRMPEHQALLLVSLRPDKSTGRRSPTVEEVIAEAKQVHADGVGLSDDPSLDGPFVEKLRQAGLDLEVWTVDSPEAARRLIALGVRGITTNRAGWLKEHLAGSKR